MTRIRYSGMSARLAAAAVSGALFISHATTAQVANPTLAPAMDAAFAEMMRDPTRLEATFEYAGAAAKAGNYEGAIAALERMLMIDPNLPRVRLELGVLYFRLESFDLSRSYLRSTLESGEVPPDVKAGVENYLAEIERKQTRHRFSGSAMTGVRYQTNATSGFGATTVPIPAIADQTPVDIGSGKRRDWNLFTAISATHSYDLGEQSDARWESSLSLYGTRQSRVQNLDVALGEITTGPRLSLASYGLEGATWRPYGLANSMALDGNRYMVTAGGGAQAAIPLTASILGTAGYEHRTKNYRTDASRSTVRIQNAAEHALTTGATWMLTGDDSVSLNTGWSREIARLSSKTVDRHFFTAGYTRRFPPLWPNAPDKWTLGGTVGRHLAHYRTPDGSIDAGTRRGDFEWRYGILIGIPLTEKLSLALVGQRQTVASTYLINKYNNNSISAGVSWLF